MFYAIINELSFSDKWTEECREVGEADSSILKALLE